MTQGPKTRDLKVVCDNLDRLVTAPLRTLGHPRAAYVPKLYRKARSLAGSPISYLAAKALMERSPLVPNRVHGTRGPEGGAHVALVSGTYNPVYFPGGETDGPIGAAVLGRALNQLGLRVTFCVE